MDDPSDYELRRTSSELSPAAPPSTRPVGLWVTISLLIVAGGAAAYVAFASQPLPLVTSPETPAPTPAATQPPRSLGGEAESVTVPPLDASDALVRTLVRSLSENPAITTWLATNGLVRNFTVVVANIAEGTTPAKHLRALRPSSAFRVVERDGNLYVDPRSYERYSVIADAVASVDPARAAKLYATFKARIEEADRDLGFPDRSFDRTLQRAIVALLDTPILDEPVRLRPKGIGTRMPMNESRA